MRWTSLTAHDALSHVWDYNEEESDIEVSLNDSFSESDCLEINVGQYFQNLDEEEPVLRRSVFVDDDAATRTNHPDSEVNKADSSDSSDVDSLAFSFCSDVSYLFYHTIISLTRFKVSACWWLFITRFFPAKFPNSESIKIIG